jgi:hypothetical protein
MTGYLRIYVGHYATLAEPLQRRKTKLLRHRPTKGNARRDYSLRTILETSSPIEIASFESLQEALSTPTYLVHFSPIRILFIDLDASKESGFGAVVYHVLEPKDRSPIPEDYLQRLRIQPIIFLSRLLNAAK